MPVERISLRLPEDRYTDYVALDPLRKQIILFKHKTAAPILEGT